MEIIIKNRRAGKTTSLIKLCSETQYTIVCANKKQVGYIGEVSIEMGINIPVPITFDEFVHKDYNDSIKGFLIDDADCFIQQLTKVKITAMTLSNDLETMTTSLKKTL
ncbi:hypothetical protein [Flavobacterium sp. '19STA2R22 D10 B1']|uniref:hypothetical protein n=1 Tax=Flavobacterium aerium TaxID=3037261 RepID=UPI00278C04EC|nr:hypothetical protein [Flavobacterium sp. '19STA2R22 D10 B1']